MCEGCQPVVLQTHLLRTQNVLCSSFAICPNITPFNDCRLQVFPEELKFRVLHWCFVDVHVQ